MERGVSLYELVLAQVQEGRKGGREGRREEGREGGREEGREEGREGGKLTRAMSILKS